MSYDERKNKFNALCLLKIKKHSSAKVYLPRLLCLMNTNVILIFFFESSVINILFLYSCAF